MFKKLWKYLSGDVYQREPGNAGHVPPRPIPLARGAGWVEPEKEKAANEALIQAGLSTALDPIYFTDGYPRVRCSASVNVGEEKCVMIVREPSGKVLETYNPSQIDAGRYLDEWLRGIAPRCKPATRLLDQQ